MVDARVDAMDARVDATVDGGAPEDAGAPATSPCPGGGQPCRLLPFGDSLTHGIGDPEAGGYRSQLFQRTLTAGKSITFMGLVGDKMDGPATVQGVTFPASHEGNPGWTTGDMAGLIPTSPGTDPPHIVLLLAGTNDMKAMDASTIPAAPDRLDVLIGAFFTYAPDALVVVALLPPLADETQDAAVGIYNLAVAQLVAARASAGDRIVLADMNTGFIPEDYLDDDTHPNPTGYAHMADVWYGAIEDQLR